MLSYDPTNPFVTSEENPFSHEPWKNIKLEGNIEKQFLFTTILSNDLVPFGYLRRRIVILPIFLKNGKTEIISNSNQSEILTSNLSQYLEKAESYWREMALQVQKMEA